MKLHRILQIHLENPSYCALSFLARICSSVGITIFHAISMNRCMSTSISSSSFGPIFFQERILGQDRRCEIVRGVQQILFQANAFEVFKNICQQINIRLEVQIVIISQMFCTQTLSTTCSHVLIVFALCACRLASCKTFFCVAVLFC